MKRIAIIPARGGSKRLPRKNVLPLQGKPLLAYSIETALESGVFDSVYVSSDDKEALQIAKEYNVSIAVRPPHLATDQATVAQTCLDLLSSLARQGASYDEVCCLYATSPLRTSQDIVNTLELLKKPGVCFSRSVCGYPLPPWQAQREDEDGNLSYFWPSYADKKSQELPHLVVDNGSIYAAKVPDFFKYGCFSGPGTRGYEMPYSRSVDINTMDDFKIVELLVFQNYKQ
ncbi:acylneuraminate cytidylyltransferase family protein [Desulfovibrio subterraneus]|uniref:Acylneuraminate cytidylyltransferase n=1 Tax=Desulfovibrio subterraneus TaxID=2718620 RepID=A0A7J0BPK6_9BACT|nr:acylneuraminate cytidylyltransferase family protein [Desulfovibrio subterraneus]GFM35142.1 acylneuraminate cytidylyltransferase [Desulfovibrio subterraneus]